MGSQRIPRGRAVRGATGTGAWRWEASSGLRCSCLTRAGECALSRASPGRSQPLPPPLSNCV
eukprot:2367280-Rhodomonas_salina.1